MTYTSSNKKTEIIQRDRYVDTFIPKNILWGLIKWEEFLSTDHVGSEVHIVSEPDTVIYLNGKKIK